MDEHLPIRALRRSMKLTLAELGARLNIGSEGHLSEIERGLQPCPFDTALALEAMARDAGLSLDAGTLNDSIRRARETAPVGAADQPGDASELAA